MIFNQICRDAHFRYPSHINCLNLAFSTNVRSSFSSCRLVLNLLNILWNILYPTVITKSEFYKMFVYKNLVFLSRGITVIFKYLNVLKLEILTDSNPWRNKKEFSEPY